MIGHYNKMPAFKSEMPLYAVFVSEYRSTFGIKYLRLKNGKQKRNKPALRPV